MSISCDVNSLMQAAACFDKCLAPGIEQSIKTYLLCQYGVVAGGIITPITATGFTFTINADWTVVTTSWDAPPAGVTNTEIWTSTDNITFALEATIAAPSTSTTVITPPADTKYAKIRWCNAATCGVFTVVKSVTNGIVADWVARVITNGGAAPAAGTQTAVKNWWNSVFQLRSQIICLNFFAPDNLIACITPFIKGPGNDPWTNHNFFGNDLNVTGLQGNGQNKYLDTGITWANTAAIYGSNHFGVEIGSRQAKGFISGYTAGTYDGVNGTSVLFSNLFAAGPAVQMDYWGASGATPLPNTSGSFIGFHMGERYSLALQTNYSLMSDNVGVYTFFTNAINNVAAAELLTALPIFVYCANGGAGVPGTPGGFSNITINWVSMSTAFNAADAQTFANAAHTLRDALGGSWN